MEERTAEFCDERHAQLEKACLERHGNLNNDIAEIKENIIKLNVKFDNHLTHIEGDIVGALKPFVWMQKHPKVVVGGLIILAVTYLAALVPNEQKLEALKAALAFFKLFIGA